MPSWWPSEALRLAVLLRELQDVDAAGAVGDVDVLAVPVRGPRARVVWAVVRDLARVRRVADVEEPGALRVERLHQDLAADVEVVRGAVVGRRVAALLAVDAPRADALQAERLLGRRTPAFTVVRTRERGDRQDAVARAAVDEVLLRRVDQVLAAPGAVTDAVAGRVVAVVHEPRGRRRLGDATTRVRERLVRRRAADLVRQRVAVHPVGPVAAHAAAPGHPGHAVAVHLDVVHVVGLAVVAGQLDRLRVHLREPRVADVGAPDRPPATVGRRGGGVRRATGP